MCRLYLIQPTPPSWSLSLNLLPSMEKNVVLFLMFAKAYKEVSRCDDFNLLILQVSAICFVFSVCAQLRALLGCLLPNTIEKHSTKYFTVSELDFEIDLKARQKSWDLKESVLNRAKPGLERD